MSSFNNNPYSFQQGASRLLAPVNGASNASYVWNASSGDPTEATVCNTNVDSYYLANTGNKSSAPNIAPSIPEVVGVPGTTSIQVVFNVAGVTGNPYPTMSILWGTTTAPTISIRAIKVAPTLGLYVATVTGLTPNTTYFFKSVASNTAGAKISAVSLPITTSAGGGVPPSGPPTVPTQAGVSTSSSIVVQFSVTGITGTPTPTFSALIGETTTPTGPIPASLVSGDTYVAIATGLKPNTTYYFKSVASNGNAPDAVSAVSAGFTTSSPAPVGPLKTNLVTPFLIQGPRFGQVSPWPGIDYYINVGAVGAYYTAGGSSAQGQQVFASMYGGTVGAPGDAANNPANPVPYAGACIADQPFAWLGGSSGNAQYSDTYLKGLQTHMGTNGRILACWGGFEADVLGLFGPYQPPGYPGTNPAMADIVKSFLYNYCGITAGNTNPLNWVRTNSNGTSNYEFYYDGLIIDFENVGAGNYMNNYPTTGIRPAPETFTDPKFATYQASLGAIPSTFYAIAPNLFFGSAPVSLSIVADQGKTNICAANTGLNSWWPFATASIPPSGPSGPNPYNDTASDALNHPTQLSYMNDVFVQFYNESPDYYLGGKFFVNVMACWGFVALQAQALGRKKTTINLGFARGNIIPGGPAPFTANTQGPTPQLDSPPNPSANAPYTYWYPQYAKASDGPGPNYTTAPDGWVNTGVALDPPNLAKAITDATTLLQTLTGNPNLVPSDWCSGMGFWAGPDATIVAQAVYTQGDALCPGPVLPQGEVYCWSDASYPAPDPYWVDSTVPIDPNLPPAPVAASAPAPAPAPAQSILGGYQGYPLYEA